MGLTRDYTKRRKPEFKLPPGATDAHCHVFGPGAVFPYSPNRKYTPEDAPKEDLTALHEHLGVSRTVIVQASCHGPDNRAMLDALAWKPKEYRGVAIVDASTPGTDYPKMAKAGVRGVRFNFVKHLGGMPDLALLENVVRRIKPLGWHLVFHIDAKDIGELSDLILKQTVPVIIDHMGRVPAKDGVDQPPFQSLLKLLDHKHVWVKVCGSERISMPPYDEAMPIAKKLMETAGDRTLWGTDFPHPNSTHDADEADLVDLVPKFAPDAAMQKMLLVDNPAKLYGFK
jgi:predicted TIM-barrel fold metal-dependent hydrolase